jgi:hypothetical protein
LAFSVQRPAYRIFVLDVAVWRAKQKQLSDE